MVGHEGWLESFPDNNHVCPPGDQSDLVVSRGTFRQTRVGPGIESEIMLKAEMQSVNETYPAAAACEVCGGLK